MLGLNLFGRLNLNSYSGVANDDIYFYACVGTPIGHSFFFVGIVQPSHQLLDDQMLESMTIVCSTSDKFLAMKEVVGNADVEIVETGSLYQPTLHHFGVSWDTVAQKGVFKNVEIGTDGGGMYATFLGYIIVVDNFTIGESGNLQKSVEGIKIANQSLFLYFFLQVYVYITCQEAIGTLGKIMGGNHSIGNCPVNVEIRYLSTDKRIKIDGKGTTAQSVMPLALQLAGTGPAKDEDELALNNEAVHLIEQFGNLWDFIDDDQRTRCLVFQTFIE